MQKVWSVFEVWVVMFLVKGKKKINYTAKNPYYNDSNSECNET